MATSGDVSWAVTPDSGFPPGPSGKVVGDISVSVQTQTSLLFSPHTGFWNRKTGLAKSIDPSIYLSIYLSACTHTERYISPAIVRKHYLAERKSRAALANPLQLASVGGYMARLSCSTS